MEVLKDKKKVGLEDINIIEILRIIALQEVWKRKKLDVTVLEIPIGDKTIKIELSKASRTLITCSDGRKMWLDTIPLTSYNNVNKRQIKIEVRFDINEFIQFSFDVTSQDIKELINGKKNKLPTIDIIYFNKKEITGLKNDLSPVNLTYEDDHIIYEEEAATLSLDGTKIIELDDEELPDMDEIFKFDAESIKKKIQLFNKSVQVRAKRYGIADYTGDFLAGAISLLEKDARHYEYIQDRCTGILKDTKELIKVHDRITELFSKSIFTKEELTIIARTIDEEINRLLGAPKESPQVIKIRKLINELPEDQKTSFLASLKANNNGE